MAFQWHPGRNLPGVVNDHDPDPNATKHLCGCFIVGGPDAPHIHFHNNSLSGKILSPGCWIIYKNDERDVMSTKEFEAKYQPIDQILF